MELLKKTARALEKRGFTAAVFEDGESACAYIRAHLAPKTLVGVGGSMTVRELGLADALRRDGHEVLWHWEVPAAERPALLRRVLGEAGAFVCSVNALCTHGTIVQIDGTGNRVAALCYGPEQVFLLVGRNKLVDGTVHQAIARVKREACCKNARRLGLSTPCAQNGACDSAHCAHPMCTIFAALEHAPGGKQTHVLLVNQSLGY